MHGEVWALWAVCGSCILGLGKDSQQSQLQSSVRDPLFFVFLVCGLSNKLLDLTESRKAQCRYDSQQHKQ